MSETRRHSSTSVNIDARRIGFKTGMFKGVEQPRLRFDRIAMGLVSRLQTNLVGSVPKGKTVIVTITAPIRRSSKTAAALEDKIRTLLAARRSRLTAMIHRNRIQVRVLKGGADRTSKLIGFVHNPEPGPELLFEVTRLLLECMGSSNRSHKGGRGLSIANGDGLVPVETLRQVCRALRDEPFSNGSC